MNTNEFIRKSTIVHDNVDVCIKIRIRVWIRARNMINTVKQAFTRVAVFMKEYLTVSMAA